MSTPADMFLPSSTANTVQYGVAELAGADHLETLTFHPDTKPLTDESLNFLTLRILKFSGPLVSVRGLQRTFSSCRTGRMYTAPEVQQAMAHLDMSGLGKILKSSRKVMFAKISPGAVNPHALQLVAGQSVDEYREHFERCHKQVLAWSDQVKVHVLGLCQKTYGDQYATYVRRLIGCDAPIQ
ncbi:uncharacterized protein LOC106156066 [Lingula anatina]|uniref:Uncharacterized protein LOC106156066 n=1 Tax=Lingula anatina TaxID=7574 RepID=A0A1S3HKI8_LINAN|nr:uncharacterized protein LOC106156066 [Lingula anatina]|eukprot:XP_013386618.1 uncharacterized protein LOC106156066 [Lingula anatina]